MLPTLLQLAPQAHYPQLSRVSYIWGLKRVTCERCAERTIRIRFIPPEMLNMGTFYSERTSRHIQRSLWFTQVEWIQGCYLVVAGETAVVLSVASVCMFMNWFTSFKTPQYQSNVGWWDVFLPLAVDFVPKFHQLVQLLPSHLGILQWASLFKLFSSLVLSSEMSTRSQAIIVEILHELDLPAGVQLEFFIFSRDSSFSSDFNHTICSLFHWT